MSLIIADLNIIQRKCRIAIRPPTWLHNSSFLPSYHWLFSWYKHPFQTYIDDKVRCISGVKGFQAGLLTKMGAHHVICIVMNLT